MAKTAIHPSAIIGKKAQLGEGNEIGPGSIIEDGASLGSHNKLWMNVYVGPGTTIGHRNTIREYVTIHRGTKEGTATVLGDDNFLMANAHLGHNCQVGHKTTLVNLATLAGYCAVEDGAVLSGMVVVHQFVRIGRLAMISGLSAVNKDVPPYLLCGGRPAVIQGLNAVGMRRAGIAPAVREEIKRAYKLLYREGLNVPHAIEAIARECASPETKLMVEFVKQAKRGISAGLGEETETVGPRKVTGAREAIRRTAEER